MNRFKLHALINFLSKLRKSRVKIDPFADAITDDAITDNYMSNQTAEEAQDKAIKQVNFSSIRAADPYDFQTAHRRAIFLLRLITGGFIASIGMNIMLLTSFQSLLPLKDKEYVFLNLKPEESRIYEIQPISSKVKGFNLLLEQKAQEFVLNLLAVDEITQRERLRNGLKLASKSYHQRYIKERVKSGAIQEIMDAGIVRDIRIVAVDHIKSFERNIHKLAVDFDQIDLRRNAIIERKALRAYLSMTTLPQSVSEAEKYENPLGIRVLDMAIKFRGTQAEAPQKKD